MHDSLVLLLTDIKQGNLNECIVAVSENSIPS